MHFFLLISIINYKNVKYNKVLHIIEAFLLKLVFIKFMHLFIWKGFMYPLRLYARYLPYICYGSEASENVAKWRQLVSELQSEDLDEKLYEINRFFNRFDFVPVPAIVKTTPLPNISL